MTAPGSVSGALAHEPGSASGAGGLGHAGVLGSPAVRTMAAAAALALAVSGRGDLLFLGGLLALALADRRASIAALLATVAVAVRWGGTSADTITGAVTTLGPGLRLGPPLAAIALGLAALALVLAAVGAPLLPRLAAVVSAATLAIGPVGARSGGAVALGLLAAGVAVAVAVLLPRRLPTPSDRLRRAAPFLAGAAVLLAAVW